MADGYRDFCEKQHRLIAHYLAIQAWYRGLDCIVLNRAHLETFLELKRFKATRIEWMMDDMKSWFPFQKPYYNTKSISSIHSLYLSRMPLDSLPAGPMPTERRIERIPEGTLKAGILDGNTPTLREIVTYLGLLADGLGQPQHYFDVKAHSHKISK